MGGMEPETFDSFAMRNCADLIRSLAAATGCRTELLDARGRIILAAGNSSPDASDAGAHAMGFPLYADQDLIGRLVLADRSPALEPLLAAVARAIGTRFGCERDCDRAAQQVLQTNDESRLLCRLTRILRPDESLTANAEKLLRAAAALFADRLLFLYLPQGDAPHWSARAGKDRPALTSWLEAHPDELAAIRAALGERGEEAEADVPLRQAGTLTAGPETAAYLAVAICGRSAVSGFVCLLRDPRDEDYDSGERKLLDCLAGELSNTTTTSHLHDELNDMLFNTVRSLVAAIDAKDPYTRGHSERVYRLSAQIGEQLGLSGQEREALTWASMLHDIGKMAVSVDILNKPGPLTAAEFDLVRTHSVHGCKLLDPIPQLRATLPAIRSHHERFDGNGYPDGLAGEDIPLLARIIALADTYDAIVSERAFRPAQSSADAVAIITHCNGTQFDPAVVRAFLELVARDTFDRSPWERTEPAA